MKVYMSGLIYLTGCGGDVRAYAPTATGHHGSLWIESGSLNEKETEWWDGLRRPPRDVGGVALIEFVIPQGSTIQFPGSGKVDCGDIEDRLPKLKMKKKKAEEDELEPPEQDFVIDLAKAQTNAEVDMHGGSLTPLSFGKSGLIEWTIPDRGVTIVVMSKGDHGNRRAITLTDSTANVLFLNSHELPAEHHEKDALSGNHAAGFKNLNPDPNLIVYPVSAKLQATAWQKRESDPAIAKFMTNSGCSCGAGTPCCC